MRIAVDHQVSALGGSGSGVLSCKGVEAFKGLEFRFLA